MYDCSARGGHQLEPGGTLASFIIDLNPRASAMCSDQIKWIIIVTPTCQLN